MAKAGGYSSGPALNQVVLDSNLQYPSSPDVRTGSVKALTRQLRQAPTYVQSQQVPTCVQSLLVADVRSFSLTVCCISFELDASRVRRDQDSLMFKLLISWQTLGCSASGGACVAPARLAFAFGYGS